MNAPAQSLPSGVRKLPGEVGLWIFILSDLLLFGLYFVLFAHDLAADLETYQRSRATLSGELGLVNTLLLLSGSWAVVMGTRVESEPRRSAFYLIAAALSGVLFLMVKAVEYTHLIGAGHSFIENGFYRWYFFLTSYHALHVAAGVVALLVVAGRRWRQQTVTVELVEAAGCYWHLVDLLWIGIFSLIYLI